VYYFLYNTEEFIDQFEFFDRLYIIYTILMSFSQTYSKNNYFENYNKSMWENDFNTEKFNSMYRNLITPMIKINKDIYNIEINDTFTLFLKKILGNNADVKGFLDNGEEEIKLFETETMITDDYIKFFNNLLKEPSTSSMSKMNNDYSNNFLNIFEINKLSMVIFFKQLYYLNKIFKNFKAEERTNSPNLSNNFDNYFKNKAIKKSTNVFDKIMFSESKNFNEEEEKYIKVGNFHIKNSKNNLTSFDMMFRKSTILGVEIIDILFYDTTTISQYEKEIANAEVESRRQYHSLVSDKFMTPVQVLLLYINDISNQFTEKKSFDSKVLSEMHDIGVYIQTMNQDITCCSRMESGIDVTFEKFRTEELFNLCINIINLLIKNNSTKCYSIKTKLIIYPEVPHIINSDINRLRQVLINFLSNAYKFTLNGEIKVVVKLVESNSLYDEIRVDIKDTGIGVKENYIETLISQIQEIEDLKCLNLVGNGLGLQMSNVIVNRLGRKIIYEHKEQGSNFYFSFFNIKSHNIVKSLEKDKFQKMIDLIDIATIKPEYNKNVSFKLIDNLEVDNFLETNKMSNSTLEIKAFKINNINKEEFVDSPKNIHYSLFKKEYEDSNKLTIFDDINIKKSESIFNRDNDFQPLTSRNPKKNMTPIIINSPGKKNSDTIRHTTISLGLQSDKQGQGQESARNSDKVFDFEDIVFDFYKINKNDSVLNSKSLCSVFDPHTNKCSALFHEISLICSKYHDNVEFLKVYENFKPYIKFFYKKLKNFDKQSNSNSPIKIKRILIVDDNKPILKALKNVTTSAIKDLGLTNKIEILKAYDGVDALALFKIDHYTCQSINYIISDHNMSMMDGSDLIKLVNRYKLGRHIKLIISSTDNELLKSNIQNVEFLNKPIRKSDIKTMLSNFTNY